MFEKDMRLAYLLDFYGEALDKRTYDIMQAYYDDDLSLAEIADGEGISRQGVRHIIKKGEEQLDFLENKLGLATFYTELKSAVKKIDAVKQNISNGENQQQSLELLSEVISVILSR